MGNGHMGTHPVETNRQIATTKNITFLQLRWRKVKAAFPTPNCVSVIGILVLLVFVLVMSNVSVSKEIKQLEFETCGLDIRWCLA